MELVNENIRILRTKMGLTQEKFAELLGVKRSLIGAYEEGRAFPPANNLLKLSKVFNVSLDDLVSVSFENKIRNNQMRDEEGTLFFSGEKKDTRLANLNFESSFEKFGTSGEKKSDKKGIPYINSVLFEKYILNSDFGRYSQELPHLQLPFLSGTNLMAFDAPGDFLIENSILICEKIQDKNYFPEGQNHLLVTKSQGFLYRRIYNQLNFKGVYLVSSDKTGIPSLEISMTDVKEIWKIEAYFSKNLPQPSLSLEGIRRKIDDLKTEIDFMDDFQSRK